MSERPPGRRLVLAVASGGGHWVQLLHLRPAFEGHELVFASVSPEYSEDVAGERFHVLPDATRHSGWGLLGLARRCFGLVLRERPDVVLTTGAAPGLLVLMAGKLLGARTVWVDSIANVERMSLSGRLARPFADCWLTQWPDLARPSGPRYEGSVL